MIVKFAKNYLSYKADQEVEFTADEAAELIAAGKATEVKADDADVLAKAVEVQIQEIAEKAYAKGRDETKAALAKSFGNRKPSIIVGRDNELDKPWQKGEFASALVKAARHGELDVRLKATGSSTGTDADGGYAVPDLWASDIYHDIVNGADLFSRCFNIPMSGPGSTLKIPASNINTLGTNGLTAQQKTRAQDGSSVSATKVALREISIDVNRLVILAPVTDDLLADGIAMEAYLEKVAALELSYRLNNNILRGGTVATGIIGHAASVVPLRTTANLVKFADIRNMWARRYGKPGSFVWIVNQEVEAQLFNMEDSDGHNIYFAPGGLAAQPFGTIFGAPVLVSEHASTLGSEGDIVLASLDNYLTVTKGGVEKAMSGHVYFDTAEQAFRWTMRVGGRPARAAVITPATGQGSATLSPFVVLDDATS